MWRPCTTGVTSPRSSSAAAVAVTVVQRSTAAAGVEVGDRRHHDGHPHRRRTVRLTQPSPGRIGRAGAARRPARPADGERRAPAAGGALRRVAQHGRGLRAPPAPRGAAGGPVSRCSRSAPARRRAAPASTSHRPGRGEPRVDAGHRVGRPLPVEPGVVQEPHVEQVHGAHLGAHHRGREVADDVDGERRVVESPLPVVAPRRPGERVEAVGGVTVEELEPAGVHLDAAVVVGRLAVSAARRCRRPRRGTCPRAFRWRAGTSRRAPAPPRPAPDGAACTSRSMSLIGRVSGCGHTAPPPELPPSTAPFTGTAGTSASANASSTRGVSVRNRSARAATCARCSST